MYLSLIQTHVLEELRVTPLSLQLDLVILGVPRTDHPTTHPPTHPKTTPTHIHNDTQTHALQDN